MSCELAVLELLRARGPRAMSLILAISIHTCRRPRRRHRPRRPQSDVEGPAACPAGRRRRRISGCLFDGVLRRAWRCGEWCFGREGVRGPSQRRRAHDRVWGLQRRLRCAAVQHSSEGWGDVRVRGERGVDQRDVQSVAWRANQQCQCEADGRPHLRRCEDDWQRDVRGRC